MECGTMMAKNPEFDSIANSFIKIYCTPGCGSKTQFEVWGASSFLDKSSLCRAAVFTGMVDDTIGGEVNI